MRRVASIAGGACLLILQGSTVLAQANVNSERDLEFRTYERTADLALEMFTRFVRSNGHILRASTILRSCNNEGLAKAVDAKIRDRKFVKQIEALTLDGKFAKLPSYAMLQTQAIANGMVAGYIGGYTDGVGKKPSSAHCQAAVQVANDILK